MEKQIEVEYIGKIDKEKFEKLKRKLELEGTFKKRKERISFMYFRDLIPKDISEIKDETVDLRIRITNKEPEIILKKGLFTGTHSRKEISINFSLDQLQKYVNLLSALDWNIGVTYAVETFVYRYKGVEISLVSIEDYGYNFEAEILTTKENEAASKERIESILRELTLIPFNEAELNKQCNEINNRKKLRFDFSKQSLKEIQEKYSKFF